MTIVGTPSSNNDELFLEGTDNEVDGLAGDDTIDAAGGDGNNILRGGDNNDELIANFNDQLFGDGGDDFLEGAATGGAGGNTLEGGVGNDTLSAGSNDILNGGDDTDLLIAGAGGNTLTGGNGADIFLIANQELPGSENTLTDFNADEDTLSISITGVDSLEDLGITADGENTVISFGTTIAIVQGIAPEALNTDNVTFEIGTTPENNPPTADDDIASTDEDTPVTVVVPGILDGDTDPDDDPLTITEVNNSTDFTFGEPITLTSGAILTLNADGSYVYNPNGAFEELNDGDPGEDSFTYTISDGTDSDTATVTISITGVTDGGTNNPPTADNDSANTDEDTPVTVVAPGILDGDTDPDDNAINITQVNGEAFSDGANIPLDSGATLTLNADGSYVYNPNGAFEELNDGNLGEDSFTYTISDGELTATATVTINITGVTDNPDAPDAVDDEASVAEGDILTKPAEDGILANDTDPNGIETVDITEVNGSTDFAFDQPITLASGAILTLDTEGGYTYNPNGQTDSDSFTYTISDGTNEDTATVNIDITGAPGSFTLDIDGNGQARALSDGLLIVRHLFDVTGDGLIAGVVDTANGTRTTAEEISQFLTENESILDIDGNGQTRALSDGLLIIRHLFQVTGDDLIAGVVDTANGTRTTAEDISNYLNSLSL